MTDIKNVDFLDYFIKYPGMFIGKKSLYGLQCFLAGCVSSGNNLGIDWADFEEWVYQYTQKPLKSIKSFGIAFIMADKSDEGGFTVWTGLLEVYRFKKQNGEIK